MDSVKFTLTKPVNFNGETFSELTFRAPDVGCMIDAEEAGESEGARFAGLIAAMCGMPIEAFRKVSIHDFRQIGDLVKPLIGNFEKDGEASGETSPS